VHTCEELREQVSDVVNTCYAQLHRERKVRPTKGNVQTVIIRVFRFSSGNTARSIIIEFGMTLEMCTEYFLECRLLLRAHRGGRCGAVVGVEDD
jgi:hypothetical protein